MEQDKYSVNEVLSELAQFDQQFIYVEGIMVYAFESFTLSHWPRGDAKEDSEWRIWLEEAPLNYHFDYDVIGQWNCKRIVVGGTIFTPKSKLGCCGHMGATLAAIECTSMERFKTWEHNHPA